MKKLKITIIAFCLTLSFACDEDLPPPAIDFATAREKMLVNDWTYDYILMGTDTIRALTFEGEPRTVGVFEAVELLYRRYDQNHAYQYRWDVEDPDQRYYGSGINYQPNFGYWKLSENGETLIHNQLQTYEKQFEILELTENSLRIRLIGDRTSFLTNGEGIVLDTITGPWVEVFVPRDN